METLRITETSLIQLINDLQQDYTTLFNQLKNATNEKERERIKSKKADAHSKLITKLLETSLKLKNLLNDVKNIK